MSMNCICVCIWMLRPTTRPVLPASAAVAIFCELNLTECGIVSAICFRSASELLQFRRCACGSALITKVDQSFGRLAIYGFVRRRYHHNAGVLRHHENANTTSPQIFPGTETWIITARMCCTDSIYNHVLCNANTRFRSSIRKKREQIQISEEQNLSSL